MFNEQTERNYRVYSLDDPEIKPLLSPYLKDDFVKDLPLIEKIAITPEHIQFEFGMLSAFKPEIGKFHVSFLSTLQIIQQVIYLFAKVQYPNLTRPQVEFKNIDLLFKKLVYATEHIPVNIIITKNYTLENERVFHCKLDFGDSSFTGFFDFVLPVTTAPERHLQLKEDRLTDLLLPFQNIYKNGSRGNLKDFIFDENGAHATVDFELKTNDLLVQSLLKNSFSLVGQAQLSIIYGLWYLGFQEKPGPVILTRLKSQLHEKKTNFLSNHLHMKVQKELKKGSKNFLSLHTQDEIFDIDFNLCVIEGFEENF